MAGETTITVIGNLTNDPELRFTPSGSAVANFTIASTPRTFDRQSNEWKDGETLFLRASVWREAAENVAESLTKGTRVIVSGRLKSRSYETKEGEKRTVIELEVDEIGPSLRYANAKVNRTQRSGGQGGFGGGNSGGGFGGGQGGNQGGNTGGKLGRQPAPQRRKTHGPRPGSAMPAVAGATARIPNLPSKQQNKGPGQYPRWVPRGSLGDCRRRTTTIPWITIHGLHRIGAPRWLRLNSVSPNQSPTP
jgi:single-strand DNA-binding protein